MLLRNIFGLSLEQNSKSHPCTIFYPSCRKSPFPMFFCIWQGLRHFFKLLIFVIWLGPRENFRDHHKKFVNWLVKDFFDKKQKYFRQKAAPPEKELSLLGVSSFAERILSGESLLSPPSEPPAVATDLYLLYRRAIVTNQRPRRRNISPPPHFLLPRPLQRRPLPPHFGNQPGTAFSLFLVVDELCTVSRLRRLR